LFKKKTFLILYAVIYTFRTQQLIKTDLDLVWSFFSNPEHIHTLTPAQMRFRTITQNLPNQIHENLVIVYKISPIFPIPLKWETKIISVKTHKNFVDILTKGPYKKWHHLHTFEKTKQGVLLTDEVTYELPFDFIGNFFHRILVKKKIEKLFTYRTQQINKQFKND